MYIHIVILQWLFRHMRSLSFSITEDTVVSEPVSSKFKFRTSPQREELSSSPFIDEVVDISVMVLAVAGEGEISISSTGCWRLQYIMLAVNVRIIFGFTCHNINTNISTILREAGRSAHQTNKVTKSDAKPYEKRSFSYYLRGFKCR